MAARAAVAVWSIPRGATVTQPSASSWVSAPRSLSSRAHTALRGDLTVIPDENLRYHMAYSHGESAKSEVTLLRAYVGRGKFYQIMNFGKYHIISGCGSTEGIALRTFEGP